MNKPNLFHKVINYFREPERKLNRENAVVEVNNVSNLFSFYSGEMSGLTPERLHAGFDFTRKGSPFFNDLYFEEMVRRDLHIGGVMQTRSYAPLGEEWEHKYSPDSPVSKAMQDNILAFLREVYSSFETDRFFVDSASCNVKGVAPFEICYLPDGKYIMPSSVDYVPLHMTLFDDRARAYRFLQADKADMLKMQMASATSVMQDRVDVNEYAIPDIDPRKILIAKSLDGRAVNGFLNGSWWAIMWGYLFKVSAIKDWASYLERFAIPSIVGKYDPMTGGKEDMENLLKDVGSVVKVVLSNDKDLDIKSDSSKGSTSDLFKKYVDDYWDNKISIRVIGHNLTAQVTGNQKTGATVGENVRIDIKFGDLMAIKKTCREFDRRLIDMNFGKQAEYPGFGFLTELDTDFMKALAEVYTEVHGLGYRPKLDKLQEVFDTELEPVPVPSAPAFMDSYRFSENSRLDREIKKQVEELWKLAIKAKERKAA